MAGYDPREGRPKVRAWLTRIEELVHPHYTAAHKFVNDVSNKHKGIVPDSISKL